MRSRFILPTLVVLLALCASGCRERLTWPAPTLGAGSRVIDVPPQGGIWWGIPPDVDCDVRMPSVPVRSMAKVSGCRNIRVVGGEFASEADPCSAEANGTNSSPALFVTDFAGTAHVEGIKVQGPGFSDGIWMTSDRPASVGQVEGTWIGGLAACSEPVSFGAAWPYEHPDCFQTWNGPLELRFDKNTCRTPYQGFYLDTAALPGPGGEVTPARSIDIRRTNVRLDERTPNGRACFMVWTAASPTPDHFNRVRCNPGTREYVAAFSPRLDVDPDAWGAVIRDDDQWPDEIEPDEAGIGYR